MKILVTGPQGQIGWELMRAFPSGHELIPVARPQMDLSESASIRHTLREVKPDLILNAAGYTAVDRAEQEPELAAMVNSDAVAVIGEEARRLGAGVVHFSTDYIFDGRKQSPYVPTDLPHPLSVYGKTKLEGEIALANSGAAYLILRTSWVYSLRRRNFVLAILRQAAVQPMLRIVNDQTGSPTPARSIAQATAKIVAYGIRGHEGVHHLTCGGATTWYQFAERTFDLAEVEPRPNLVAVTSAEYNARAMRPAYSVLDCQSTEKSFGVRMADWETDLKQMLSGGAASAALAELARSGDA